MPKKCVFVYGGTKLTLEQVISWWEDRTGRTLYGYGENPDGVLDALAHLQVMTKEYDNLHKLILRDKKVSSALLTRLQHTDEDAHRTILALDSSSALYFGEAQDLKRVVSLLASALNDMNNDFGEDAAFKKLFGPVEALVDAHKG